MASISIQKRRSSKRKKVTSSAFNSNPQVSRTNQSVTPTGAAVAVRPSRTYLRRMDNRGVGTVSYA